MSKKELVILAGSCYPISSATGSIAINFGKYLSEQYHISIIAIEQDGYSYNGDKIDGFDVYTISNWRLKWAQKSKNKRDDCKGLLYKFFNLSLLLARIFGRLEATFFSLNNNAWYIEKAYKKLEEINTNSSIDVVLTCAAPHEAHRAGRIYKKKHPEVRWVTYWGDLMASRINKLNIFVSMKKMKEMETELACSSDYVLSTVENYNVLLEETNDISKVKALPYTLNQTILNECADNRQTRADEITIVYMGAFYRDIRNPEYFLKLFSLLPCKYRLLLYSTGNCEDIVNRYVSDSNGRIIQKGLVPKKQLISEVKNVDILVNIQNKLENSNPSKILELVSYGKPIIDFSYTDETSSSLARYPYCLNINMEHSFSDYVDELTKFILDNCDRHIDIQMVKEIYSENLEDNVKQIVVEAIGG